MARLRPAGVLALAAAACVTSGCRTSLVRRGLEKRLERRLHGLVGPAERYTVRIRETRDAELVLGRAHRVEIEGRAIHALDEFRVDAFQLTLYDFRYEGGEPYFVSVRRSDLQVEFSEAALNEYLQRSLSRYQPQVWLEEDRVRVRITYKLLGTPTVINATGRFHIREGRQLLFDAEVVDVSLINQPGFGERFVEDRINPLLDLSRIGFPARLDSVQVLPGRIRALGSAAIPPEVKD